MWAVFNASHVQIDNVWVKDREGQAIRIGGIQSCTFYTLLMRAPVSVHFTDPFGGWHRPTEQPPATGREPTPKNAESGSDFTIDLKKCSG